MTMRIYVYDGDELLARIDGDDEVNCVAIFDRYYGSNDYTWDSHGDDLAAVDMELSSDDPAVIAALAETAKDNE